VTDPFVLDMSKLLLLAFSQCNLLGYTRAWNTNTKHVTE